MGTALWLLSRFWARWRVEAVAGTGTALLVLAAWLRGPGEPAERPAPDPAMAACAECDAAGGRVPCDCARCKDRDRCCCRHMPHCPCKEDPSK